MFEKRIRQIQSKEGEMRNELQKAIQKFIDDRFAGEHDPWGRKWADLSPRTWAKKKTNRILYETGKLYNSIKAKVENINDKVSAVVGGIMYYGHFHQTGTRKMPARPFFGGYTNSEIETLKSIIRIYL